MPLNIFETETTDMKKRSEPESNITVKGPCDRPVRSALDLVSEISTAVHAAMPHQIAEEHMQRIRLAMGDLTRYFGSVWPDSLPIEWLLAVSPEKVATEATSTGSCLDSRERARRVRLVQLHACAFGVHAPVATEMLLIEAHAAQLRRGQEGSLPCIQLRLF